MATRRASPRAPEAPRTTWPSPSPSCSTSSTCRPCTSRATAAAAGWRWSWAGCSAPGRHRPGPGRPVARVGAAAHSGGDAAGPAHREDHAAGGAKCPAHPLVPGPVVHAGVRAPVPPALRAGQDRGPRHGRRAWLPGDPARPGEATVEDGAAITVPVTIAFGSRDRVLLPGVARRRDQLPNQTRWVTLSGCGHVPMFDDPQPPPTCCCVPAIPPRPARSASPSDRPCSAAPERLRPRRRQMDDADLERPCTRRSPRSSCMVGASRTTTGSGMRVIWSLLFPPTTAPQVVQTESPSRADRCVGTSAGPTRCPLSCRWPPGVGASPRGVDGAASGGVAIPRSPSPWRPAP